ncbi:MAG: phosphoribosyltransferase, partial [Flavobacteriales bacterium]|nr:phosphoribosyltransferase [Flavobacteriales bacterium]
MAGTRTVILEHDRIQRKLRRIAFQVYEGHVGETSVVLVGVAPRGAKLAMRLKAHLEEISPLKVELHELALDKDAPMKGPAKLGKGDVDLNGRAVVLV